MRNLGLAADGRLVLIDWEHVGTGPVGIDLVTFVSLHQVFGGMGERALLTEYAVALSEVVGRGLYQDVELGFAPCHLTWGLHLRLGPGLTAVRKGVFGNSEPELARHLEDICSGSLRAPARPTHSKSQQRTVDRGPVPAADPADAAEREHQASCSVGFRPLCCRTAG